MPDEEKVQYVLYLPVDRQSNLSVFLHLYFVLFLLHNNEMSNQ